MTRPPDDYVKTCSRCGESKTAQHFHGSTTTRDKLQSRCKQCQNAVGAEYAKREPDKRRKSYEKWRRRNLPVVAALARKWRKNNPERFRDHMLKANYGLPLGTYAAMLATQGGGCAICGTDKPGGKGRFHVDHCHDTNLVRGLLCNACNIGIGNMRHDERILLAAVKYLAESRSKGG
jgi:Recombination endonuclease VII